MRKEDILLKRRYLLAGMYGMQDYAYYNAYLLNTFGVVVDKPQLLTKDHVESISSLFKVNVPRSFYDNPQDLKYYTTTELLLEQIVSYFVIAVNGVHSENSQVFDRIELFKKVLPNYEEGKELVLREYKVISDSEAAEILLSIATDLSTYTRKWNKVEEEEFSYLFKKGFYNSNNLIKSKDNAIAMFKQYSDAYFAKSLDQKDIVKLSVELIGEKSTLSFTKEQELLLTIGLENCYDSKLSKKQAKYFNQLAKKLNMKKSLATNENSPYKLAIKLLKEGKPVEAAKVYAKNGSMLERNLVHVLSRTKDDQQAYDILELVQVHNPLVAIQFVKGLTSRSSEPRTFKFTKNRKVKKYSETRFESENRKSILTDKQKDIIKETMDSKINEYYRGLKSLGKIYIDESFKKIALPLNTSASTSGIDTIPTGSRLPVNNFIRLFTYWKDIYDVDTSLTLIDKRDSFNTLYYGDYHTKKYGNDALHSGDVRDNNGAEYIDINIPGLLRQGYKYVIYGLNAYSNGTLNNNPATEIFTGYQNKKDLDTIAWSPKNIAMQMSGKVDSKAFIPFAIDLTTSEMVILNTTPDSNDRTVNVQEYEGIKEYLSTEYLDQFNVYKIVSLRGELVNDPKEADVIFSDIIQGEPEQQKIRSIDIEQLVKLLTV